MPETAAVQVTYYRSREAFPGVARGRPDDVRVGVDVNGEFAYEFTIEEVGPRGLIGLRVQFFTDSWRAFSDLPEFFALLATLDESTRGPVAKRLTLDELLPHLAGLGWTDVTADHAARHVHVAGCVTCGQRNVWTAADR